MYVTHHVTFQVVITMKKMTKKTITIYVKIKKNVRDNIKLALVVMENIYALKHVQIIQIILMDIIIMKTALIYVPNIVTQHNISII